MPPNDAEVQLRGVPQVPLDGGAYRSLQGALGLFATTVSADAILVISLSWPRTQRIPERLPLAAVC